MDHFRCLSSRLTRPRGPGASHQHPELIAARQSPNRVRNSSIEFRVACGIGKKHDAFQTPPQTGKALRGHGLWKIGLDTTISDRSSLPGKLAKFARLMRLRTPAALPSIEYWDNLKKCLFSPN